MANHSVIPLKTAVTPEDVERHSREIIDRKFKGKINLVHREDLTESWDAERAWIFEVPNSRPKKPGPMWPDENIGFCFWLNKGGRTVELRHVVLQSWVSWAQSLFEHELAQSFGVKRFNGGDGNVKTDPAQYKDTCKAFYMRNMPDPTPEDMEFLERRIFRDIPEGWE